MLRALGAFALGLLVVGAALGCGDDAPPVTVPMSAPPPPEPTARSMSDSPSATADPTGNPSGGNYRLGPMPGGTAAAGSGSAKAAGRSIHACCDALDKAAKSSTTEASRKLYEQSTRVCYQKANQILQGKVTFEQALAQVRSSLLGAAPPQCY